MKALSRPSARIACTSALLLCFTFITTNFVLGGIPGKASVVLKSMEEELARSMQVLKKKATPAPYFISFQIAETHRVNLTASYGAMKTDNVNRSRLLDVYVRVGSPQLDNTHRIRGDRFSSFFDAYSRPVNISLTDDPDAIKSAIWLETDKKYKAAAQRLIKVNANQEVSVEAEDKSADFSSEKPQKHIEVLAAISVDAAAWKEKLKTFSALFNRHPDLHSSSVSLAATVINKYFVSSEGTAIQQGRTFWRIGMTARTRAEDGMELYKYEAFDAATLDKLPGDDEIKAAVEKLIKDVIALRNAPAMEPFTGPAILSGRASAVFFHEIFGHRIEGHRQKNEEEGQTFTKKINKEVLPEFISVYDDPTVKIYGDKDLNGHYLYDDEGVKAQRVTVVDKGILKNFLMSRSPIKGFSASNGHGRKQAGFGPVARQGNLIIESSKTVSDKELRKLLIQECKKQEKPYGLLFEDISGGFTNTRRYGTQSFNVIPITVYRVYVDGRPDEMVRGVQLIGTPLTSFSKITACGDKPGVFNGTCGAESGGVPVSGISPAILTTQIEVQKKYKASDKPPVLPPPTRRTK